MIFMSELDSELPSFSGLVESGLYDEIKSEINQIFGSIFF